MKKITGMLVLAVCMLLVPCVVPAAGTGTEETKAAEGTARTSGGYQYRVEDNYAVITGYTGESAWAIIPESLDGYEVREIGDSAFEENRRVEAVTVPKTVVRVGDRAFSGMENLNNVTFKKPDSPAAVQEIGEYAFASCPHLIAVALPASVRQIAENAFLGAEKDPKPTWNHSEFHISTEESAAYVLGYAEENHYKVYTGLGVEKPKYTEATAVSKDRIRVSWGSAVFADRYRVYREYGDGILDVTVAESTFVGEVTGLYLEEEYVRKGYVYRYYVVAVGTPYDGGEDRSGYDTDETDIALIGRDVYEMESLRAQPDGYTSLKLTWKHEQQDWSENKADYDDKAEYNYKNMSDYFYRIYRKEGDSWKLVKVIRDPTARSTVITGLKCGQEYTFAIQACTDVAGGLFSESVYTRYTAAAMVRPAAPVITSVRKASQTSVRVSWKKVAGATGYAVYRSGTKNGSYRKVATVGSAQSFADKNLKRGKTYYYKVVALRKVSGKNVKSKASVIKGKRV